MTEVSKKGLSVSVRSTASGGRSMSLMIDLVVGTIGMISFILLLASSFSTHRPGTDAVLISSPQSIGGRS